VLGPEPLEDAPRRVPLLARSPSVLLQDPVDDAGEPIEPLPTSGRVWSFVMIAASAETVSAFLHEIAAGSRGFATLRVWHALAPYLERDTGRLTCSQRTLAKTAGVTQGDVYRALLRLTAMGALIQDGRGKYRIHPAVMWRGELATRQEAEGKTHPFTVVEGGKGEK
jgi:hypothetical protein